MIEPRETNNLHRSAVREIAAELCELGVSDRLQLAFTRTGAQSPTTLWDPVEADIKHPVLRQYYEICHAMADENGQITFDALDLDALAPLFDWLILIDVEDDGETLRYSHYGKVLANLRGRDMTGQTVEAFGGHISLFFDSVYRAVMSAKRWMFTTHEPPRVIFARIWQRIIVPVLDQSSRKVCRFAVITVPENELRAGLDIIPDPVLIADADLKVRFANRAACEVFEQTIYRGSEDISVADFTGVDLDPIETPEEMARRRHVHDRVKLTIGGAIVQEFMVTLSATVQFGRAFYVITLRPILNDPAGDFATSAGV